MSVVATSPATADVVAAKGVNLRRYRSLSGFGLIAALLALWEASSRLGWAQSTSWPAFSDVVQALGHGLASGELLRIFGETLSLMLSGYAIGAVIAIGVGLSIGMSGLLEKFVAPVIEIFRPVPVTAIVPPLILFLGVDAALKIFAVAFSTFFPVVINTASGVRDVNQTMLQTARTFRLSKWDTAIKFVLPGALPAIFAGLRTSVGIAFAVTIVAEMIAGSTGVGYYIVQTQYSMQPAAMYAAILCLSAVGYALNLIIRWIERRALPWYGA
ncbi:ABC transporter permease [Mesorhizobium sp. DCY119]|uniref:ABC transporter permease n=1 Tax=Mesorhizobium sp. DCY119 TaxID=2108445 RepID=UPI001402B3C6|nr:ABC transporter permease [Mesorhizobium sp. DCY119]